MNKLSTVTTISVALASFASLAHAGDAPAAGAPAVPSKMAPPPAADAMKPPAEIAEQAKAMAGTWKCTGSVDMGGQKLDVTGTVTHKADASGWWITSTIDGKAGKIPMLTTMMMTYDAGSKKWFRMAANSHGGHSTVWGTMDGKKVSWEGDARWGGKDLKTRGSEESVSPKEVHITNESTMDGGKTWNKEAEITCKK